MRKFKQKATLTLTTAALLAGSVAMSSPANAASSPIAACGGGSYHQVDSHALSDKAIVYLMYNGSTDCVVTWKQGKYYGNGETVNAYVWAKNGDGFADGGYYKYYAGPSKVTAPGQCVRWGGGYSTNLEYDSPWEHCG
ncbi:hypothetical protein NE236_09875 [Actinoallomurus purpureus]|uniref:hypothetical protein n=1 Tax=Actinoallomurus purpureus TaxID=478114 RepID=UPI0020922C8E|nr:hypothetical protein [Actinoallomurus purpureus]MCO6005294.1 hypothetical protein [Actinoallomurus purpureus]